jgi:HrpA-like RNA helicase
LFKKAKSEKAYEALIALKSKIFSINVPEVVRLIEKTNEAKKLIENKDVIFVIGDTGSGKTTNIHRFLGYNLKPVKFK